jgi:hypothetical protein
MIEINGVAHVILSVSEWDESFVHLPSLWSVGCRGGDAPWQPFIQADLLH